MRLTVQYVGSIQVRLGKKEEEIDIEHGISVLTLLRRLADTYGEWFKQEVLEDDGNRLQQGIVVTVNGVAVGQLGGPEARLKDGDIVTILPLFAGGG
ncbi:MAG: MoaD/ThiS family protein [Nitrososphaerota archaeon]